MSPFKHAVWPALAIAMMLVGPRPAEAQNGVDVSAGYQFGGVPQNGGSNWQAFPSGWYVDLSGAVRPTVALVGEVGAVYKAQNTHEYSYQGGVRVFSTMNPMVTPFAQVLIGGSTSGGSGSSVSAFSLQGGGGIDINPTKKVGFRIAADYRPVFFSAADGGLESDIRVALGVVLRVGK